MDEQVNQLKLLRNKAVAAISEGEKFFDSETLFCSLENMDELIEEIRIYQAELEIQNAELSSQQLRTESAQRRFEEMFQSLPLAALVIDSAAIVRQANIQSLTLFGFKSEHKLVGHSVYRLFDEQINILAFQVNRHGKLHEVADDSIVRLKLGDGRELDLELYVSALSSNYRMDPHYIVVFTDRTEECSLQKNKQIYESMIKNSNGQMSAFDREGRCVLANQVYGDFWGVSSDDIVGKRRNDWMGDENAGKHERDDAKVLNLGNSMLYEERVSSNVAGEIYLMHSKFPITGESGEIVAIGTISADMTEKHERDSRLAIAMKAFSNGAEGMLVADGLKRIIYVNNAFEKITGYSEDEVIELTPSILKSGKHNHAFYSGMWESISENGRWEGEIWNRKRNGAIYPQWLSISRVEGGSVEEVYYVGVFTDLTSKKLADEKIERLAFYDNLTGLPNRHLLMDRARQVLSHAARYKTDVFLVFMDLDYFKNINDTYGHDYGDDVLLEVVRRVRREIRTTDTFSRLGGDEFVFLFSDADNDTLSILLERILASLSQTFLVRGKHCHISASMGVAAFPGDGQDVIDLLKHADIAMYEAKREGRNRYRYFDEEIGRKIQHRLLIENSLRHALKAGELFIELQPKIDMHSRRVFGAEALLRWRRSNGEILYPESFIGIAAESSLILDVDYWVIDRTITMLSEWYASGLSDFVVSINISSRLLWSPDFVDLMEKKLDASCLPHGSIEIEVTERDLMLNSEIAVAQVIRLKEIGLRISIDDFGTGYSSLSCLRMMPVDTIKLDQSFVGHIGDESAGGGTVCRTIIDMASNLGIATLAEGVETESQYNFLIEEGCNSAQGYYFARPMAADKFMEYYREER